MENDSKNTIIFISRPASVLFLAIYSVQVIAIIWLLWLYLGQRSTIDEQNKHIEKLEDKLKILEIIEDYQIGFTEDEVIQLANVIYDESDKFGLDPLLILAVIISESSFKKNQRSHMGAEGLMQIKPSIAEKVAEKWGIDWPHPEGLWNPGLNVSLGTAYLFELILKFEDVRKAIIAYNLGETVTREYFYFGAAPPARYYERVKDNYMRLRSRFDD